MKINELLITYEIESNENAKKGDNICKLSKKYIKYIQDWMNNYSRKLFNYKSANDIFYENLNNCLICCNRF